MGLAKIGIMKNNKMVKSLKEISLRLNRRGIPGLSNFRGCSVIAFSVAARHGERAGALKGTC